TEGTAFSGQVATFTDANSKAPLSDFPSGPNNSLIDWGDGSTSAGIVTQAGGPGTAFLISSNHTYAEDGSYTVKVTVTDIGGATFSSNASVRVAKRFDLAGRASQTGQLFVGTSDGSSFSTSVWGSWSTAVTWVDVQSGDFNGDGRADLVGRVQQSGDWWVAL